MIGGGDSIVRSDAEAACFPFALLPLLLLLLLLLLLRLLLLPRRLPIMHLSRCGA